MQPVSFGAMLRIKSNDNYEKDTYSYINPLQVSEVVQGGYGSRCSDHKSETYICHGNQKTLISCPHEKIVEALHEAQQTTDKPYIDLVV